MDFSISPELETLRARIAAFVAREIIPLESDPTAYDAHENIAAGPLEALRAKARAEGLWCLQLKPETGGLGVGRIGMAVCYEAMNRSIFGPVVFNSAAPDDGNMMVLEAIGTPAQKQRWLAPIVRGRGALGLRDDRAASRRRLRPLDDPDAGAKGSATATLAHHGRKWFITGAAEASHFITDRPHLG